MVIYKFLGIYERTGPATFPDLTLDYIEKDLNISTIYEVDELDVKYMWCRAASELIGKIGTEIKPDYKLADLKLLDVKYNVYNPEEFRRKKEWK